MSYLTVALITENDALIGRVTACVAIEGEENPGLWVAEHKWAIAGQPGWGEAWDFALSKIATPTAVLVAQLGRREDVITDGMILAAVQAIQATRRAS